MSGVQATQILEAVTRAAEAASQAALALKESNDQAKAQRSGFAEASKVVKCPASFGSTSSTEYQANWLDFAFSFKQWLVYAEPGFETDLKHVEDHLNVPVSYTKTKSRALGILSALMTHPAFTREKALLEQVQGLERIAEEYRKGSGAEVADDSAGFQRLSQ